ncbi:MAG: TPM domain-containing protein [Firmicutes bacterium]|nr:TPM domain-containing protein [Bacillota bacterium]
MKKRFFSCILLILIIIPIFFIKAEPLYDGSIYRFNDYCGAVSEAEDKSINDRINESIEPLKTDFPIFALDEYKNDMELSEYADIVYVNNKFGYGEKKSGIFLIIDTENEVYNIFFYGDAKNNIPKPVKERLFERADELFNDDTLSNYDMFNSYLDSVFAMSKEWNVDKADKADGMPYWYVDDTSAFENYHAENPPRVVDDMGLLTEEQKSELTDQVQRICDTYDFSYVIFIDDSTHGLSKDVYAADFLYYGGYGKGDDFSACCFFLSLEEGNRGWRTVSTNSYESIFTSDVTYTIDEIVDRDMRNGNYFTAIKKQADYIEKSLSEDNFEIISRNSRNKVNFFGWPLIVGLIISFVIAEMVISDMKRKMRLYTAVSANEYLVKGSLNIRNKSVRRIYTTITRTAKRESSSGGGSSYSSGSASSGGSYSSGGRDF